MIAPTLDLPMMPGRGLALSRNFMGDALTPLPRSKWRHPWQCTPAWNAATQRWCVTIEPGFVNAKSPTVRTSIGEQTTLHDGRDFGTNPLTGKPFFSDPIFNQGGASSADATIDLPLYVRPALPLNWHTSASVPAYFAERGAFNPQQASVSGDGEIIEAEAPPPNSRLLNACTVWIHQPRLALTSEISIEPGLATGISNVTQTLGLNSALAGDKLRMFAGLFQQGDTPDPLSGVYEEAPYDELPIATIYALSPPNTEPGTAVDASWAVSVEQAEGVFWDLQYATPWFKQYGGDPSAPFIPPLAGGAAQLVINYLTASINDLLQQALNLVTAHSQAGTFYVPTGGGHSIKMPVLAAKAKGRNGADRQGRIDAEKAADRLAARQIRLNPPYPFGAVPFNTALLRQTT